MILALRRLFEIVGLMVHILTFRATLHCWWLYNNVTRLRYKKFEPCLTQVLLLRPNSMRFVEETIELLLE